MERGRLNEVIEPSVKDYMDVASPEIMSSMMSYVFEKDGDLYYYNLEVTKVSDDPRAEKSGFPVYICMGGDEIPKDGCRMINDSRVSSDRPPRSCSYCGNSEFKKIESEEELKSWRDNYES